MPKSVVTRHEDKVKHIITEISQLVSGPALDFFVSQIKMAGRKKRGYRWTVKDKSLALTLLHSSPKTYRIMSKIFLLPSKQTLSRSMQKLKIFPGFNEAILEAFKLKVQTMSEKDKLCAILFDEMSIKENVSYNFEKDEVEGLEDYGVTGRTRHVANHALVFLVRGLHGKWKQPIGYFLTSGTVSGVVLKDLLLSCLDKVNDIGLDPKIVICDQGSNNRNAITLLGITVDKPFFQYNEKKVLVMYDPPHLLKNVRNNFKKSGYVVGSKKVLWQHIEDFYIGDSQLPIRMAPKLTRKHIDLPMFATLRVKLAAQVLSHSVAAGLMTRCSLGSMPAEAAETAHFVEQFDKLFNVFNSSDTKSSQQLRYAISDGSKHFAFLESCLKWLESVSSAKNKKTLPCFQGWKMAIKALVMLWEDLHVNYGFSYLLTNRLNQDCVENLFSVIRGKGGQRDNPDACQFRLALRQVMVDRVLLTSDCANCESDVDNFLFNFKSIGEACSNHGNEQVNPEPVDVIPSSVRSLMQVFMQPSMPTAEEDNILVYICGYLCRKLSKVMCRHCVSLLCGTLDPSINESHTFLSNKQFSDCPSGKGLITPSTELVEMCTAIELEFRNCIIEMLHVDKIRSRLFNRLAKKVTTDRFECEKCNTKRAIILLYVNVRMHHVLRENNQRFTSIGRKNRKILKLDHV